MDYHEFEHWTRVRYERRCGHATANAELPGMGEMKGPMKAAPKRPAASRLRYRSAGYQRACHREVITELEVVIVDSNSLLVFILLPLLVLAAVITFLLLQRARRKRDAGQ